MIDVWRIFLSFGLYVGSAFGSSMCFHGHSFLAPFGWWENVGK